MYVYFESNDVIEAVMGCEMSLELFDWLKGFIWLPLRSRFRAEARIELAAAFS